VTHAPAATGSFTYTKPPEQTVKVRRSGNGSGKVTSSPAGIRCPKTCAHKFAFGTSVILKAKPARSSAFAGWSGACKGKSACKVKVTGALSITAKFTRKTCVVPNVEGKSLSSAKRALAAHSCSAGKITHAFSTKVAKGRVISQRPKPGSHLKRNGRVSLTVSRGKR
jgi:hypothetical protein